LEPKFLTKAFLLFVVRLLYSDFSASVFLWKAKVYLRCWFLERLTVVETIEGLIGRRPPAQVRLVMSESWCSAFLGCVLSGVLFFVFKESV
jgi:hypothetical protein